METLHIGAYINNREELKVTGKYIVHISSMHGGDSSNCSAQRFFYW
jgi:hypothetical protein